jgi:hypothetical protein
MLSSLTKYKQSRSLLWAAFAVFVAICGWFLWSVPVEAPEQKVLYEVTSLQGSEPIRMVIPAAGIDASFTNPLGLFDSGEIEVPEGVEEVGYYKYGPTPGEIGPAVVLGHVDSKAGPAVFYSLGELTPGDEILIEREDGTTAVFVVEKLERHEQSGFPTEKVYSDLTYAGLRLITCSGVYNNSSERYSHNLIVFARLKEVQNSTLSN